jgi:alpha-mannosidase
MKHGRAGLTLIALTIAVASVSTQQKTTLYLVATAHLDSQWNWTVQDTIRQFVPNTFYTNFKYIDEYPDYVFSWEGAIHYMWFKEYHPEDWARLQKYVAAGRWRLAGSWINAVDTNMPSPESLMRQALYAQRFFRQEFNQEPQDVYLPDCFGFGFALPAIAAHSGLKAFSTQKLTWGRPIPFPLGRWKGVDGSELVAALDPKSYGTRITTDISVDPDWANQPTAIGAGNAVELRYFGTGDVGGGPTEESVQNLEKALKNSNGRLSIKNTSPDQLSRDLSPVERAALPEYQGELILKTHGTGCYTSQAAMKRWNRQNELLADEAERSGVAAQWLTGRPYPTERLREAWIRVLWHQFHDDLTGTCIPQAYQFSWNDELASANQFANALTSAATAVSSVLNTSGDGVPLVVFNPLSTVRRDAIEATVHFAAAPPPSLRVVDAATGRAVAAQVLERHGRDVKLLFVGRVPSVGYSVFHVRAGGAGRDGGAGGAGGAGRAGTGEGAGALHVTLGSLENNRLLVRIDKNGDIASVFDKDAKHELLSAPAMLELRDDPSGSWPAWEVLYDTVRAPAREYVSAPVVKIIERGPVRVALEITRKAAGSTFVQRVRLTDGGDRVDVENLVDWRSPNSLLKVSFPLAASNPKATYDLGLGTIERTNNEPDQYEVPAQKWADVTDRSRTFGVGIINDSKYGWDKPNDTTLRLTLIHTPRPDTRYSYQSSNDLGHHRFVYAIAGHAGDWRAGRMPQRAAALNQPLLAFQATLHEGALGRAFSLASLDDTSGQVAIVALKKAEDTDDIVLRLQERYGDAVRTTVRMPAGVVAAHELNAAEETVGPFVLPQPAAGGRGTSEGPRPAFPIDLKPYETRTLALRLQSARTATPGRITSATIDLPFNLDGVSLAAARNDGDFDGRRQTIAGELLPSSLELDGVMFKLGSSAPGAKNVLVPKGDSIALPAGHFTHVYVLASAVGGDVPATFLASAAPGGRRTVTVREWQGPIGQWDSRLIEPDQLHKPFVPANPRGTPSQDEIWRRLVVTYDPATGVVGGIDRIRPGFVKRDEIAWIGTHRHAPDEDEVYVASYVFKYDIELPAGARQIRLPNDSRLRIFAMTAVDAPHDATPAFTAIAPELAAK